jgi:hypothetical protein
MDAQLMVVDIEHLLAVTAESTPAASASDADPAGSGLGDGECVAWQAIFMRGCIKACNTGLLTT